MQFKRLLKIHIWISKSIWTPSLVLHLCWSPSIWFHRLRNSQTNSFISLIPLLVKENLWCFSYSQSWSKIWFAPSITWPLKFIRKQGFKLSKLRNVVLTSSFVPVMRQRVRVPKLLYICWSVYTANVWYCKKLKTFSNEK